MKKLDEILMQKGKYASFKPATDSMIRKAESLLSLQFSDDYKEYVKKYGSLSFIGHELSGVTNCPEDDVVELTKRIKDVSPEIPDAWYVLENTGMDGIIIWQDGNGFVYKGKRKIFNNLFEYIDAT